MVATPKIRTSFGLQDAGGQRPVRGAAHHAIHVALDILIERRGAASNEQSAAERVHQAQPIERTVGGEVEAGDGGDDDEKCDVGLGEDDVSPRSIVCGNRFGASVAHSWWLAIFML